MEGSFHKGISQSREGAPVAGEPATQTVSFSLFIHWKFAHGCNVTFAAKSHIHISAKEEEKMRPKALARSSGFVPIFSHVSQVSTTTF